MSKGDGEGQCMPMKPEGPGGGGDQPCLPMKPDVCQPADEQSAPCQPLKPEKAEPSRCLPAEADSQCQPMGICRPSVETPSCQPMGVAPGSRFGVSFWLGVLVGVIVTLLVRWFLG